MGWGREEQSGWQPTLYLDQRAPNWRLLYSKNSLLVPSGTYCSTVVMLHFPANLVLGILWMVMSVAWGLRRLCVRMMGQTRLPRTSLAPDWLGNGAVLQRNTKCHRGKVLFPNPSSLGLNHSGNHPTQPDLSLCNLSATTEVSKWKGKKEVWIWLHLRFSSTLHLLKNGTYQTFSSGPNPQVFQHSGCIWGCLLMVPSCSFSFRTLYSS